MGQTPIGRPSSACDIVAAWLLCALIAAAVLVPSAAPAIEAMACTSFHAAAAVLHGAVLRAGPASASAGRHPVGSACCGGALTG